jgi:hypothetical protein
MDDPAPGAFVEAFADSGINLQLGFWISDPARRHPRHPLGDQSGDLAALQGGGHRDSLFPQREVSVLNPAPIRADRSPGRRCLDSATVKLCYRRQGPDFEHFPWFALGARLESRALFEQRTHGLMFSGLLDHALVGLCRRHPGDDPRDHRLGHHFPASPPGAPLPRPASRCRLCSSVSGCG